MELKEQLHALKDAAWTSQAFTAQELDKMADLHMPIILKVIDGYYGSQHIETFSSDQILWIYGKIEQKRIIGIDKDDNHISIAFDTPIRFENKYSADKDADIIPQHLSELLEENSLPLKVSIYAGDFSAKSINGTELSAESIGNLTLIKHHTMTNLIGVCLQKENIDEEIQNLPMYLNNRFKMATSKDEGSRQEFEQLRDSLERMVNSVVDFENYTGSSDIIVYQKADMTNQDSSKTNYNSLRPQKYTVNKKVVRRRSKKKQESEDKVKKRLSFANMVSTVRKLKPEGRRAVKSMLPTINTSTIQNTRSLSDSQLIDEKETSFLSELDGLKTNDAFEEHTDKDLADGGKPIDSATERAATGKSRSLSDSQLIAEKETSFVSELDGLKTNDVFEEHTDKDLADGGKPEQEEPKVKILEKEQGDTAEATGDKQQPKVNIIKPKQGASDAHSTDDSTGDKPNPETTLKKEQEIKSDLNTDAKDTQQLVTKPKPVWKAPAPSNAAGLMGDLQNAFKKKTSMKDDDEVELVPKTGTEEKKDHKQNEEPSEINGKPKPQPRPTIATKPKVTSRPTAPKPKPTPKPRQVTKSKPEEDVKIDSNGNAMDSGTD